MALLAAQAHLLLDEDRDRAVGEREQEGERRGVVEHDVGAERGGEDRDEEAEGGPSTFPACRDYGPRVGSTSTGRALRAAASWRRTASRRARAPAARAPAELVHGLAER